MPTFQLFNRIPGVQILEPDPLTIPTSDTTVKVRFTDSLLWMPEGDDVPVTGAYDDAKKQLILSADFTKSGDNVTFLENQLKLNSITVTIAVADHASGDKVLDTGQSAPVSATGRVEWKSEMIAWLKNEADGALDLALSYEYGGDGQSGFQLKLANSVELDRVFVKLQQGSVRVDVLPEETALLLTLVGDAALVTGGTSVDQIASLLEKLFGASNVPSLDPPAFVFQRKFRLADGMPDVALERPRLSLLPQWGGASPTLDTFDGLDVTLGSPRFTFDLPAVGDPLPDLALTLKDSSLRLLDLPNWGAFDLRGNLNFESDATDGWHLSFEPILDGAVTLPDIVRFFLEQIRWPALAPPFLEDLPDTLLSLAEMHWYELFEGLLDNLDPAQFTSGFDAIIAGAQAVKAPFGLEGLFALALRALQPEADTLFPLVWDNWFNRLPDAWDQLLELLQIALDTLTFDSLAILLDALFDALDPAKLATLLQTVLEWGATQIEGTFDAFLKLWIPMLAAAVKVLDPQPLADALWEIPKNATGSLVDFRSLTEIPVFSITNAFAPSLFNLRTDVLLIGTGLQGLMVLTDFLDDVLVFDDTGRFLAHLVQPLRDLLAILVPQRPELEVGRLLGLLTAFFGNAQGDEASEVMILQFGRIPPLGVIFALVGAAWNAIRPSHLVSWARLLFNSIEEDSSLNQRRLAPPGPGTKYLIFSDLHRDTRDDDQGAMSFGSIDHFSVHQQLYLDILDHADTAGYTVIEAGDGEELWFIRDFSQYPPDRRSELLLDDIISTHQAVYDKLAELHADDRYIRLIGNHDSQLRQPAVRQKLADAISTDPSKPFELYDYAIIPKVKTMDDGLVDLALALWNAGSTSERINILRQELVFDRIGLDSDPYRSEKPLIVTHGHQWDFWNCDSNNLVGKLFANSVGVPLDMANDPFIDMGGFNYGGAALVNFREIFADRFVLNNFPEHVPARRFAHRIQHQDEDNRFLIDDIMYVETITALVGYLAMPLTVENGTTRTWSQYLSSLGSLNPVETVTQLFEHIFNQLCVGHTHYPQAQPYFDIEGMILGSALADLVDFVREQISQRFFGIEPTLNLVKSRYYNSGTGGWQEGIIWAIEINEDGEARLVFWTQDTRPERPQTMDWQLPRLSDDMRDALDTRKGEVEAYLSELLDLLGDSLAEIARNIGQAAPVPLALLVAFADEFDDDTIALAVSDFDLLGVADLASGDARDHTSGQLHQVTAWLVTLFLRTLQRRMPGGTGGQAFTLAVPLPAKVADALEQVETLLNGLVFPDGSTPGDRLTELACIWLLANHGAAILNRSGRAESLLRTTYPVAWLVIALIAILPGAGDSSLPISSTVRTEAANGTVQLKLTITIN